jgi:hypothetical protein
MKHLIKKILKEELNDKINVIYQFYDVEEYYGDVDVLYANDIPYLYRFKTNIEFIPKDFKNELTPTKVISYVGWEYRTKNDSVLPDYNNSIRAKEMPILRYIDFLSLNHKDFLAKKHKSIAKDFVNKIKNNENNNYRRSNK